MNTTENPSPHSAGAFATTRWTIIAAARDAGSPQNRAAWEELARRYWRPVRAYIGGRCGANAERDADDLTQEFFARLFSRGYLERVDRAKGPFRAFLRMAAGRFLLNEWDRRRAIKRGGGAELVALDGMDSVARRRHEPVDADSAALLYDRAWALTVLERALARLRADYERSDRGRDFEVLKEFLVLGRAELDYAALAGRLAVGEGAARVAMHRVRRRLRDYFREEITATVDDETEVEAEFRQVIALLGKY